MDTPPYTGPPRGVRDLKVDPAKCPGWVNGATRLPAAGERVYTHEGQAVVVRVVGRTSDGRLSRFCCQSSLLSRSASYKAIARRGLARSPLLLRLPPLAIDRHREASTSQIPLSSSPAAASNASSPAAGSSRRTTSPSRTGIGERGRVNGCVNGSGRDLPLMG